MGFGLYFRLSRKRFVFKRGDHSPEMWLNTVDKSHSLHSEPLQSIRINSSTQTSPFLFVFQRRYLQTPASQMEKAAAGLQIQRKSKIELGHITVKCSMDT